MGRAKYCKCDNSSISLIPVRDDILHLFNRTVCCLDTKEGILCPLVLLCSKTHPQISNISRKVKTFLDMLTSYSNINLPTVSNRKDNLDLRRI